MNTEKAYLNVVHQNFKSMKTLAEGAIEQLTFEELHFLPNRESNSVAILVKHISGNMISRFTSFLTSDGEKPNRNRDTEFEDGYISKEELLAAWNFGWETLFKALSDLKEEDILKTVYIRSEPHSVMEALQRQISHYSLHIGQILYIGKLIKNDGWKTLSVPRGKSDRFTQSIKDRFIKNE
ncbi:DUF1572 family protein [Bacillus sp. RG28]|uniref:DUF1572 family protein n=1 Tax=Gottfriedia endophytica TaxID=2820819 RepID=A0A940NKV6_9BACI|nr:DUF1572 family protein [Gottfriedia endophytica]MBP0726087.1 DUF1572 family protein [Gottfriedia endophytica]